MIEIASAALLGYLYSASSLVGIASSTAVCSTAAISDLYGSNRALLPRTY